MSRTIKFRMWDNRALKMFYDWKGGSVIGQSFFEGKGEYTDFVFLQYTGLKDKKKKEIYEGDIVTGKEYGTFGDYFKGVVRFGDGHVAKESGFVGGSFLGFYLSDSGYKQLTADNGDSVDIEALEGCKIIGNIYENAELLND